MIRGFDIIVVLIFAGIASVLITPIFVVQAPWYITFFSGVALSYLYDLWKRYEIFRIVYEKFKKRNE